MRELLQTVDVGASHCLNPAHLTASDDVTRGPERGAFSQTAVHRGLSRVLTITPAHVHLCL